MTIPDVRIITGDCRAVLPTLEASSVDAVVTDPPAGISFMGKDWDRPDLFPLQDRGPLLGTPEHAAHAHDRGFANGVEIDTRPQAREGFVTFLTGALAECLRVAKPGARLLCWALPRTSHWTGTAIEAAGWIIEDRLCHLFGQGFPKGPTKLKPACEDWWLARKPSKLVPPLQIDACRIPTNGEALGDSHGISSGQPGWDRPWKHDPAARRDRAARAVVNRQKAQELGRWPAHVILDPEAAALLDAQSGERASPNGVNRVGEGGQFGTDIYGDGSGRTRESARGFDDTGGASRFFYVAKANRVDRQRGTGGANSHPTVKSTALMRWLCALITPDRGTILDPFMGSGSTGKAAKLEGFAFLGIEQDPDYVAIARRRIGAQDQGLF